MAIKQRRRRRDKMQSYDAIRMAGGMYGIYVRLRDEYGLMSAVTMLVFCSALRVIEGSEGRSFSVRELVEESGLAHIKLGYDYLENFFSAGLIEGDGPYFLSSKGEKLKYVLNRYLLRVIEQDTLNYKNTPRKYRKAKP